jgi:hypothetical protein
MAYQFKKIMKAERHEFFLCKNRHNSVKSLILTFCGNVENCIGHVFNKSGAVAIKDGHGFKKATIDKLKEKLS